ncbi:kinase-like protein, partial [Exidia glandulosa HHB12029]
VSEIADALHFLHSRSPHIIHGDVRGVSTYTGTHSVFISGDGHAFLGNFDFTPLQFPLADFDDTDNYEIIQSVRWAAPEVINGSVPIGTRSDVFAFGLFGYEVFSGHVPFHETDPVSARRLLGKNQRPPRPETDQLSDEVWNLLQRCWRRVAPARPTMEQVSQRLQELRTQT